MTSHKNLAEVSHIRLVWSCQEPDTTEYDELPEPYIEKWPVWVGVLIIIAAATMSLGLTWLLGRWFVSEGAKFLALCWPHYPQ